MENSSFETLPQDLQMEILSRLPLKILGKCICVSKKWASLIRGEDFKRFYLSRSMKRPRVMFMARRYTSEPPEPEMWWFHSVYQEQRRDPGSSNDIEALFHSVYQDSRGEHIVVVWSTTVAYSS
ncbi:F-box-like domain superfamily [Arabidopsis thaliana x Arabidopsis arenosa]|uniref:F-box-like domain superfamily n=1 Tax=Arabidopsis thaliana x Arabidopsis arenosa TaxID=1240361 RepID=A0A8T2BIV7_9BRAS|nr:F-box-like domain superfamily [Arabidopsis thaliana x Arabidopsis arenosa]